MSPREVLSIGHSNHALELFLQLLAQHQVAVLADVRSVPYSRRNPAYNKEALDASLKLANIAYLFMGKELGAKSSDPEHYIEGRVSYPRLAATALFQDGLARVIERSQTQRLAIMCAEKEPLECHRTLLVTRALVEHGVAVAHIHADGHLEPHDDLMRRMRARNGVPESDLLKSQDELRDEAYALQSQRIAYVRPDLAGAPDPERR